MDKASLIKNLAAKMGISQYAIEKWRVRQIPHRWRIPLIEAAAKQKQKLTPADLERGLK